MNPSIKISKLTRRHPFFTVSLAVLAATFLGLLTAPSASAATRWWDAGTVDIAGNGNSSSAGGPGTWDTTIKNWDAGAVAHVAWVNANNDTAEFNATTGTITLGANVTVGGMNAFTGGSGNIISEGAGPYTLTLGVTGNNTINTAASTIAGRTLTLNVSIAGASGANLVLSGPSASGVGTIKLYNANTFAGGTSFTTGANNLTLGHQLALQNSTLTLSSFCGALTFDSSVSANAFTFGGLAATSAGAGYDFSLQNNAGTPAAIALSVGNNNAATTYAGVMSGPGSLIKIGTGTLTLSGASTYSGGTTISGGQVGVTITSKALGSGPVAFSASGVRLAVSPGLDFTNAITIGPNAGAAGNGLIMPFGAGAGTATFSGPMTVNNPVAAGGHFAAAASQILHLKGPITSSVTLNSRSGTVMFSGGGTGYTTLSIAQDTCMVGANNGIATTATVNLSSSTTGPATLDLNGFNQSLAGMTKGSFAAATIGNSSTTSDSILTTTGTSSYAGVIKDVLGSGTRKVSLTVNGGSLTLGGSNTYSGDTTISAGTLLINGSTASGSAVSVLSGAALGGTGTISGSLTINSGATLAPGYGGLGTLTNGASPSLGGTVLMEINRASSPNSDKFVRSGGSLAFGGALVATNLGGSPVSGDTFDLFDATSFSGSFSSTNLPPGGATHWITSQLGVNGTITFTNNPPLALAKTYSVAQGGVITIPLSNGVKSLASDADGDPLTVSNIGATNAVNFGVAVISGGGTSITYTNTSGAAGSIDLFSYTVSDGFGGLGTNSISIRVDPAQGANLVSAAAGDGFAYLTYAGIPGTNYALDWATNVTYPVTWTQVQIKAGGSDGLLRFTNLLSSYPTNDFFRTRYVP